MAAALEMDQLGHLTKGETGDAVLEQKDRRAFLWLDGERHPSGFRELTPAVPISHGRRRHWMEWNGAGAGKSVACLTENAMRSVQDPAVPFGASMGAGDGPPPLAPPAKALPCWPAGRASTWPDRSF